MPNPQELNRMLRDLQNLLPQIAGAIVAIITAIVMIVQAINPSLPEGDKPKNPGTTVDNAASKEESMWDLCGRTWNLLSPAEVGVNGKTFKNGVVSSGRDAAPSGIECIVDKKYSAVSFTLTRDELHYVNDDAEVEAIIYLNDAESRKYTLRKGQETQVTLPLNGVSSFAIYFEGGENDGKGGAAYGFKFYR